MLGLGGQGKGWTAQPAHRGGLQVLRHKHALLPQHLGPLVVAVRRLTADVDYSVLAWSG